MALVAPCGHVALVPPMAQVVLVAFILCLLHSQFQSPDFEKTANLTSVDAGGWGMASLSQ